MTNTKFRKRALLSSVAMLLVALIALGSATFAWFVANPIVSATGLTMTTTAAPGLQVLSKSASLKQDDWGYQTTLYPQDLDLQPASPYLSGTYTDRAIAFGKIKAAGAGAHTMTTDASTNFEAATARTVDTYTNDAFTYTSGSDVYYEDIGFKKSGTGSGTVEIKAAAVKVQLASTGSGDIKNGIRVALTWSDGTNTGLIGIWKPQAGDATKTWAGSTENKALTASAYADYKDSDSGATVTGLTIPVDSSTTIGSGATIRAYIYLDGEDDEVYSDAAQALKNLVSSVSIKVSTNNSTIGWT